MVKEFRVDRLSVQIFENKTELGRAAAETAGQYISDAIDKRGEAVIILATGASQFDFLNSLTEKPLDWQSIVAFHLDEYVGLPETHPASFRKYLRDRIIDKTGIGTYYLIQGDQTDPEAECRRLESLLDQYTVDAAFVGIGENGHLAFNDPPALFDEETKFKVVSLADTSRRQQIGEGWFSTMEEVPRQAITMTIPAIMESRAIICTVPEKRKAEAAKRMLMGEISPECPASILRKHPEATLFLDSDSASMLDESIMGPEIAHEI